jgi:hypothetical protein
LEWCDVNRGSFDTIYVRLDWFDRLLKSGDLFKALMRLNPKKLIVAYHCHQACKNDLEEKILSLADKIVLLNQYAYDYFLNKYPFMQMKPVFLMPSIFLPLKKWYEVDGTLEKKNIFCVPGSSNRYLSLFSKPSDYIPDVHFYQVRYDYLRLLRSAARYSTATIKVFGSFIADTNEAAYRYKKMYKEIGPQVHIMGFLEPEDYEREMNECFAAFMTGFMPYEGVWEIEHQNYQIRYNSLIKYSILPILSSGTGQWHEDEICQTGFGYILKRIDEIRDVSYHDLSDITTSREKAIVSNSFETYQHDLFDFIF